VDYKFLDKVVDQLVRETSLDINNKKVIYVPESNPYGHRYSHQRNLFQYLSSLNSNTPIKSLSGHCRDIYGLNDQEMLYVWNKYKKIIKDNTYDILWGREPLNESHISNIPEDDYINKVVNMLGNPPYLYELESMGLSEEEVKEVFKKMYGDGVGVKYRKGKEVRVFKAGWQKGLIIYLENGNFILQDGNYKSSTYWEKWEWYDDGEFRRYTDSNGDRRFRSENDLIIYDEHIEDCCPEELEDGFYPPLPTSINENKMNRGMDIPLLTKVAQQLMSETVFEVSEFFGRYHLFLKSPMYTHVVQFRDILSKSPSYDGSVSEHIRDVYGLKWEEVNYVWLKYIDLIHQKIKKEKLPIGIQYINESRDIDGEWYYQYVFDDKYLNKVLEQLISETKIDWDRYKEGRSTGIVTSSWDPTDSGSNYTSFKKHCKEIYSLSNSEVSDMWILYIMDMKKRLGVED